ncbi:MAG TPA: Fur family transcriptional regulator [Methylococcaceae bacterium]|nr:Fur family transcriptional regulator [Methylococcaceae bacterium]
MSQTSDSKQACAETFNHDHKTCKQEALKKAEKLCLERGAQLTPIRHKVLELIWDSHEAVKAYDLLDRIKPFNDSAKPATVYRALDFLIEQKLIHRVESMNAFIGCNHVEGKHDLLLLICEGCRQIEERPATPVMDSLGNELKQAGFTARRKTLEIHGICKHCADGAA